MPSASQLEEIGIKVEHKHHALILPLSTPSPDHDVVGVLSSPRCVAAHHHHCPSSLPTPFREQRSLLQSALRLPALILTLLVVAVLGNLAAVGLGMSNNDKAGLTSIQEKGLKYTYLPAGEWKKDPHKKFEAPICCGWDDRAYLSHQNECGDQPMARENRTYQGPKDFLAHSGYKGCTCNDFHDEYPWIDDDLPPFNASQTCQKLKSRSVLMIGDSTMDQTASKFMNALFVAGCQIQITFAPGDTLVGESMGGMNRGMKWTESVSLHNPDIVIISAGPHIKNRSNFESVINSVISDSKVVKTINPNIQVVWKTQQPGGCTQDISTVIHTGSSYNYAEYYERDLYAMLVLPHHDIHIIDV